LRLLEDFFAVDLLREPAADFLRAPPRDAALVLFAAAFLVERLAFLAILRAPLVMPSWFADSSECRLRLNKLNIVHLGGLLVEPKVNACDNLRFLVHASILACRLRNSIVIKIRRATCRSFKHKACIT
jgi:hypothetical protein